MNENAIKVIAEKHAEDFCRFTNWFNDVTPHGSIAQLIAGLDDQAINSEIVRSNIKSMKAMTVEALAEIAIKTICRSDPTPKSIYTRWLIRCFLQGDFGKALEDVSRAYEPLEMFHGWKPHLPIERRDINRFPNFQALEDFLAGLGECPVSKRLAEKRFEGEDQCTVHYDSDDIKIVIPLTKEAAIYYGRNTKWCTSARGANYFDQYNKLGPLYIIIFKHENKRWQLHFQSGQFMGERDVTLEREAVLETRIPEIYEKQFAAGRNVLFCKYVRNPDVKQRSYLLSSDSSALQYFDDLTTEERIARLVSYPKDYEQVTKGKAVRTIAKIRRELFRAKPMHVEVISPTQDELMQAVKRQPAKLLHMIPVKERTTAQCYAATEDFAALTNLVIFDPTNTVVIDREGQQCQMVAVRSHVRAPNAPVHVCSLFPLDLIDIRILRNIIWTYEDSKKHSAVRRDQSSFITPSQLYEWVKTDATHRDYLVDLPSNRKEKIEMVRIFNGRFLKMLREMMRLDYSLSRENIFKFHHEIEDQIYKLMDNLSKEDRQQSEYYYADNSRRRVTIPYIHNVG